MGISDYLWPFERSFSKIPCAREATITALLGGSGVGAVYIILTGKALNAPKVALFTGVGFLWFAFGLCRFQNAQYKKYADQFLEAREEGKFD